MHRKTELLVFVYLGHVQASLLSSELYKTMEPGSQGNAGRDPKCFYKLEVEVVVYIVSKWELVGGRGMEHPSTISLAIFITTLVAR